MHIDPAYVERVRHQLAALEGELADPALASRHNVFRARLAEHAHLKNILACADRYFAMLRDKKEAESMLADEDTDDETRAWASLEKTQLDEKLPGAERAMLAALIPPNPDDDRNTIMEIRAGTGGEEAAIFAGDLFRMYQRYADQRGWKVSIMDASPGTRGGYKEIIFSVEGEQVFRSLQYESGGHRVQRVPVTEAAGRIHTSAATVAVLPEADEVDNIAIRPEDIRVDIFRSSGPGGQSVNTTDSAVRITHIPTQLVVQCQDEKSQHRNKEKALRVLSARLLDLKRAEEAAREADVRRTQIGSGDRSQRIRTYNFPQNRMTDHRINLTVYHLDRLMEGNMDELIDALYQFDLDLKLKRHMEKSGG
jgi:peptide chain release factor 1